MSPPYPVSDVELCRISLLRLLHILQPNILTTLSWLPVSLSLTCTRRQRRASRKLLVTCTTMVRRTFFLISLPQLIIALIVNPKNGKSAGMIAKETYDVVCDNAEVLDSAIIYERDFHYQYFGFKTLERSYLLKIDGKIAERPQHMLMRVAIGIHGRDIDRAIQTYNLMSERYYTHGSPTLFNAGTPRPQLSSCFLVSMKDDSIEGIYDTLKQCAMISKSAGGIGLNIHNIRATGSVHTKT